MYNDFIKLVDECIALCEEQRKCGFSGEATQLQIDGTILPEMALLKQQAAEDKIPPGTRFINSFANAFKAWDWNLQNPSKLMLALVKLNDAYKAL